MAITTYTNFDPDQTVIACHTDDDLAQLVSRRTTKVALVCSALGMNRFNLFFSLIDYD